jgi:hypothetical protein
MWKIRVYLTNTRFVDLGDVRTRTPGWEKFNPLSIYRLELPFEGSDPETKGKIKSRLIISGAMSYNFFVEATKNVSSGAVDIKKLWFLGRTPDGQRSVGFTLASKVSVVNTPFGKEYYGFATVGWKPGLVHGTPIATIVRE